MAGKRFVLDTNIWVSYIIKHRLAELTEQIFNHDLQIFISEELIDELSENLHKPKFKKYLTKPVKEYINQVLSISVFTSAEKVFHQSIDPDDDFLFDLAIKSKSEYFVTGDKPLFNISVHGLKIITMKEFRDMFEIK